MNSSELLQPAISRGQELLRRPELDWAAGTDWATETVEVLRAIYGSTHQKVRLFQDLGRSGAVRPIRPGPPRNPTPDVKRRVAMQVAALREFARELEIDRARKDTSPV